MGWTLGGGSQSVSDRVDAGGCRRRGQARQGMQWQMHAGNSCVVGVQRWLCVCAFRERCFVAVRRPRSQFPVHRVALGESAPARGRDLCRPHPRKQPEVPQPTDPMETEQGFQPHPYLRSPAGMT